MTSNIQWYRFDREDWEKIRKFKLSQRHFGAKMFEEEIEKRMESAGRKERTDAPKVSN